MQTHVHSLGQKIPLEREWLPIPVFLPGEFHRQRSLAGYSPWDCKESGMTVLTHTHTHTPWDCKSRTWLCSHTHTHTHTEDWIKRSMTFRIHSWFCLGRVWKVLNLKRRYINEIISLFPNVIQIQKMFSEKNSEISWAFVSPPNSFMSFLFAVKIRPAMMDLPVLNICT